MFAVNFASGAYFAAEATENDGDYDAGDVRIHTREFPLSVSALLARVQYLADRSAVFHSTRRSGGNHAGSGARTRGHAGRGRQTSSQEKATEIGRDNVRSRVILISVALDNGGFQWIV